MEMIPSEKCPGLQYMDDVDVGGVLDGGDGAGGEHHLLPGLLDVDDVDAVGALLEDVLLHRRLGVLGADVGRGGQHLGDVGLLETQGQVDILRNQADE